jgi:predicted Zn-dependent protease
MRQFRRFLGVLLATVLGTVLLSQGAMLGAAPMISAEPGWTAAPDGRPQTPRPTLLADTEETLQVDPASLPGNELPTPYPEPPDGTLQLPPQGEGIPGLQVEVDPDITYPEADATADLDLAQLLAGLPPEVAKRSQILMEADRLYLAGDLAAAEPLYRAAKDGKWLAEPGSDIAIAPITDPEMLPPAGRVYWREAQAGAESAFPSRVLVPLALLAQTYPEFLPGQALYARYLAQYGRAEEASQILDAAVTRYPFYPDLLKAQAEVQMAQEKWIEAAITANQFVIFNPDHPDSEAMAQLAQDNLNRFRGEMNASLTRNLVSNLVTGAAGYLLTGGLLGPFTALNSGILLMQGESGLGQQVAQQVMEQLPMVTDPEILAYVNDIGQGLAALAGRDEFTYTFEVIMDDSLNAFALPGGKVFINAGAITKSYSEAELAGLLGHEISHAVLSHGFQMVTQGNLTASLAAFIPIPEVANVAANLIVSSYSREMERQADILGTKLLTTSQYAADGLHNLMITLEEEYGNQGVSWFASHPHPSDRVAYLKQLIDQGGFNRYAYEGVETHLKMRHKMGQLLTEYKLEQAREEGAPARKLP